VATIDTYVMPVLLYGVEIWGLPATQQALAPYFSGTGLKAWHNVLLDAPFAALRRAVRLPKRVFKAALYNLTCWATYLERVIKRMVRFWNRMLMWTAVVWDHFTLPELMTFSPFLRSYRQLLADLYGPSPAGPLDPYAAAATVRTLQDQYWDGPVGSKRQLFAATFGRRRMCWSYLRKFTRGLDLSRILYLFCMCHRTFHRHDTHCQLCGHTLARMGLLHFTCCKKVPRFALAPKEGLSLLPLLKLPLDKLAMWSVGVGILLDKKQKGQPVADKRLTRVHRVPARPSGDLCLEVLFDGSLHR
jgi:hypothetical protein